MQVLVGLLNVDLGGVGPHEGQHLSIRPFHQKPDAAIRGAHDHTHAAPLTAEFHDIQDLELGLDPQELQAQVLVAAGGELEAELPGTLHQGHLVWRGSLSAHHGSQP